ncbi:MAG TPA: twin-arginine translocase subunit TatC [Spirochaetota bacterium]|nr:twin-arginine translocase subunit TatC [Spirochaetota bacterium]
MPKKKSPSADKTAPKKRSSKTPTGPYSRKPGKAEKISARKSGKASKNVMGKSSATGKDMARRPADMIKKPSRRGESPSKLTKRDVTAVATPASEETAIDPDARTRGDIPMSLVSHLDEFRSRFLVSLLTVFIIMIVGFFFSDYILAVINKPYLATGLKLNVFNLIDGFLLRLKAAMLAGVLLGFPVIVYEFWKYISPAIGVGDRMFARLSVVAALFLFYLGLTLTYLTLPFAIKALLSFTPDDMTNMINAMQYLNFVMLFCLAIGVVFELPIVIMILTKIGIVSPALLVSKRKYAIVIIWILAAVITPTVDPLTQSLVAFPLMLLYEISIVISKFMVRRKKRSERAGLP